MSPKRALVMSVLSLLVIGVAPAAPAAAAAPAAGAAPAAAWVELFDGKSLKGWVQKGGVARYEVKDRAIVGSSVPNTKNSFLCTQRRYGDFILELEFKVDAELNSGVQIRGQSRPDYQDGRVHGYQVEIDPDVKRGRMWTGGLYDEGRRGWLGDLRDNPAARNAFLPGQWNRMRVEARGDWIKTWINDVAAAEIVDARDLEGFIGLQVHGVGKREAPLTVAWRKLRIQELGRRAWRPLLPGKETEKPRLPAHRTVGGGQFQLAATLDGNLPAKEQRAGVLLWEDLPDVTGTGTTGGGNYAFRAEVKIASGNGGVYLDARASEGAAQATGLQVDLDARTGVGLYETGGRGWLWRSSEVKLEPKAEPKASGASGADAGGEEAGRARRERSSLDQLVEKAVKSWKPGDWNWVTVSVRDGQARLFLNDFFAAQVALTPGPAPGQVGLEVAATGQGPSQLQVRKLEVMSRPIPAPVPGYPVGWCIRANSKTVEDAQAAGFEFVELALQDVLSLSDEEFEKLAARLAELGMPALTGYNFIPAELKLIGPEADRTKQDEHLARGLPRLAKLGLTHVVFNSGPSRRAPDGMAPAQARQQLVDFSRRFARQARKHRLTVLLQPLRSTDTNQVTTVAEAVDVVKAVGQSNFQLLADSSFMHIQKDDPEELLKARGRLKHVWLAKPDARTYPVTPDSAAFDALFAALQKIRYRGGLSVHAKTDNFFADAPEAIRFLRTRAAQLAAGGSPRAGVGAAAGSPAGGI